MRTNESTPSVNPARWPPLVVLALAFASSVTLSRADELNASATKAGVPEGSLTDSTTTSASLSVGANVSGTQGSASSSVTYGGLTLDAHAESTSTVRPIYSSSGHWLDTITINNPGLTGQAGTARFTFSFDGSISLNSTAYNTAVNFADVYSDARLGTGAPNTLFEVNTGSEFDPPISTIKTFTYDYDFTFGSPFSIAPGADLRARGGNTGGTADLSLHLSQTNMTVLYSGNPTAYGSSSSTGSAAAKVVTNGSSFSSISLANSGLGSHGSTFSILDGTASADRTVNSSFVGAGALSGTTGTIIGDALSLSGLGGTPGEATDVFTLRMSYDEADAIAQFGSESAMALMWQNPDTGLWENAVDGNFGGTPFFAGDGAYDSATDFHLGYFGVDTADNYVWAVLDHNSEFGAGQSTSAPEPSCIALLAAGLAVPIMRRARRAVI